VTDGVTTTDREQVMESKMPVAEQKTEETGKAERRDFLYYATVATGAVAAGAAIWPLIDSMNPSADVVSQSTISIDLTGVAVGTRIIAKWAGKPIFICAAHPRRSQRHAPRRLVTLSTRLITRMKIPTTLRICQRSM
jgi:Rieske Fe-S protein